MIFSSSSPVGRLVTSTMVDKFGYNLSVHSGTMAAITFVLPTLSAMGGLIADVLAVVVGWARKRTKNHSWRQVVMTWIITVGVMAVVFVVYVWG